MIVRLIIVLNRIREAFLGLFVGSLAYKNASSDSQHDFVHVLGEWSELAHILLTILLMAASAACFGYVVWKNRRAIFAPWKKCWQDFRKLLP